MPVGRIEEAVLLHGRTACEAEQQQVPGLEPINWVHPKIAVCPGDPPTAHLLMTGVSGIDVFTPVHHMISRDLGATWTEPVDPEALGHRWLGRGNIEGIADMVPMWHAGSGKILAIGAASVFWGGRINLKASITSIPYSVLDPDTEEWSAWQRLIPPKGFGITDGISAGCAQFVELENGDILLPVFGLVGLEKMHRSVCVLRCEFDGNELVAQRFGNTLQLPVKRGLLEPSICHYDGQFLMTLRAEDGYMYYSTSDDGLNWAPVARWCWTGGIAIETHTTQQHWITHSDGLFLAYTRKMESNADVFRYRSPLLMAQVDLSTMTLLPDTERVLMRNQGVRLGNHMITHVSETETWVTDAEWQGNNNDVLLTRIHWSKPNRLATGIHQQSQPTYRRRVSMA